MVGESGTLTKTTGRRSTKEHKLDEEIRDATAGFLLPFLRWIPERHLPARSPAAAACARRSRARVRLPWDPEDDALYSAFPFFWNLSLWLKWVQYSRDDQAAEHMACKELSGTTRTKHRIDASRAEPRCARQRRAVGTFVEIRLGTDRFHGIVEYEFIVKFCG
jgi:hypothetical protein